MRLGTGVAGLACVLAIGAMVGGCGPAGPRDGRLEASAAIDTAVAAEKGLDVVWHTRLLLEPNTELTQFWLRGEFLVGLGSDDRLYVARADTGVRLWSEPIACASGRVWPPAIADGNLWLPTTTHLFGFNGAEGKCLAKIELEFSPAGPAVSNGVHCFMPDAKGWLQAVAIQPKTWSWGRWTEDTMSASPVLDNMFVYFAGYNGTVYASTQNIRNIQWQQPTEGAIVADLKRNEAGLIFAASLDYSLYAFQGPSGRLVWRYNAGERIRRAPYPSRGQVFVFTQQAGLTALDATNGHAVWRLAEGDDFIGADAETVYIRSAGNDLLAVDRASGKVRFSLPLRKGTTVAHNETDSGLLYLATRDGAIVALTREVKAEEKKEGAAAPAAATPAPATPAN